MKTLLIDGDIFVYRAGFAVERNGLVEPESHALHAARMMINDLYKRNVSRADPLEVCHTRVYLSDTARSNFRYSKAVTKPYKGHRDARKPVHYEALRDFLVAQYDATMVVGMEPDDRIGIENMKDVENSTIVTMDKDFDQLPGHHYNPQYKRSYFISRQVAYRTFCGQLLTGDPVDNIQGVEGIGPIKAERILAEAKRDKAQMLQIVYDIYTTMYGEDYFMEMGHLLWLLREEGRGWDPDLKSLRKNRSHVSMVGRAGLKNSQLLRSPPMDT